MVARIGARAHGIQPGLAWKADAHLHVDELVPDHLALDQCCAKGLALTRPVQRLVKAGTGQNPAPSPTWRHVRR
jgi:hypothetical protein